MPEKSEKSSLSKFPSPVFSAIATAVALILASHYFSLPIRYLVETRNNHIEPDIFDQYSQFPLIIELLGYLVSILTGLTVFLSGKSREAAQNKAKKAQEELAREQIKWQLAIEASQDGVWDWDIKNGSISITDRGREILCIKDKNSLITREHWEKIIHRDDVKQVTRELDDCLSNKTPFFDSEHRIIGEDGKQHWVRVHGKVIERDGEGNPIRMVGTNTDTSKTKSVEQDILTQKQELERLNELMVNRELKMIELKEKIKKMESK